MGLEVPKRDEETAEFNSAFAFLERLNQIEYLIESNLMDWNLTTAFAVLESYENELAFCFEAKDIDKVDGIKKEIVEIINNCPSIGQLGKGSTGRRYIIGQNQTGELRTKLIELNKLLRAIKQKKGMGMPSRGQGKLF